MSGKRLVLLHQNGLHQILGWCEGQPKELLAEDAGVTINGQPVALNLVACKRTYYIYKQVMVPAGEVRPMNRNQR